MNIEKYIKKINLEKLLKVLGVKNIDNIGNNFMALCPFHDEKKASWGINKKTGAYNCFSCGTKGNLISLVAKIKNIGFKKAIKWLYNYAGIKSDKIAINTKTVNKQIKNILNKKIEIQKEKADKYIITATIPKYVSRVFFYGIDYFKRRGINKETVNKNNITFCRKGFYCHRAIIPIYDENGKMFSFEARDLTKLAEKKVLYPKNSKMSLVLYNLHNAKKKKEVIIVEGIMDALYLQQLGWNVISTFGASVSEKQEELICRYFSRVYFAYDGDNAGRQATIKAGKRLSLYIEVFVVELPKGKDPDGVLGSEFKVLRNNSIEFNKYLYRGAIKGQFKAI